MFSPSLNRVAFRRGYILSCPQGCTVGQGHGGKSFQQCMSSQGGGEPRCAEDLQREGGRLNGHCL